MFRRLTMGKAKRMMKKHQKQVLKHSTNTNEDQLLTLPEGRSSCKSRSQEVESDNSLVDLHPNTVPDSAHNSTSVEEFPSGTMHQSTAALIVENKELENENRKIEAYNDLLLFVMSGQDALIASLQNQSEEQDAEIGELKQQIELAKSQLGGEATGNE